jgi:hypothetical protein
MSLTKRGQVPLGGRRHGVSGIYPIIAMFPLRMQMPRWLQQRRPTVTSDEYRAAIEAIGVNIDQSGRMLGISRRHAHRFATGESPVPPIVERFLEVM